MGLLLQHKALPGSRPSCHARRCLGSSLAAVAPAAAPQRQLWPNITASAAADAAVTAEDDAALTAAASGAPAPAPQKSTQKQADAQKAAKDALLTWLAGTRRGAAATKQLRGQIEEAQVAVEALSPAELDYSLLEGKWLLVYTTAADVVPIVGLDLELPFGLPAPVTVGNVYQRFSSVAQGSVQNIIEFTVPFLLQQQQGATFTVEASYEVRSGRRIALVFEEAQLGKVRISPGLEALLAPALLPRGYINQQLLLAIRELNLVFPFRSAQQVAQGSGVAAPYLLTYLDQDMLIGRASGTAGTFIFKRIPDEEH